MPKLLKMKNLAACCLPFLFVIFVLSLISHYGNTNVYVPVEHSNVLFKDSGKVDISIEKVESLHWHHHHHDSNALAVEAEKKVKEPDTRMEDPAESLKELKRVKAFPWGGADSANSSWSNKSAGVGGAVEVVDGGEVAVPDVVDSQDLFDSTMAGSLNYDVWHWVVGYLVDDLRISREFPTYPDEHEKTSRLHFEFNEVDPADVKGRYGHKVYGYLIPPEPGAYTFKVELTQMTAAAEVELWVSTDSDPFSTSKVLSLLYDDLMRAPKRVAVSRTETSLEVMLDSSIHYFEFLEKAFEGKIITDLLWKTPSSNEFVPIPASSFAMALKVESGTLLEGHVTHLLQGPLASNRLQSHHIAYAISDTIYPTTDLAVLPPCDYKSQYARPHKIKPYHGVYEVRESKVEPRDDTWYRHWKKKDKGNPVIDKNVVNNVVALYNKSLAGSEVKGSLVGLRSMEETANRNDGSRFLLEMDVQLHQPQEQTLHTSEYVYLKKGSDQLCHTSNFQWTKDAHVHFIVSVKNLGLWVRHLIYNMEDIYAQTGDENFSLVIVDYESEDMNIEEEAKKSSFKKIKVLHEKGGFSRSWGLQAGINDVQDKNSIVMTIDMHLTLPTGIVEYARRHTVQYKMAFAPMFFRLNKGYTEINYNGFWETLTYGLFSMYKSDWVTFGGFNTRKFKTKWGGEDWDVVDRALAKGFEAFRVRPPGLVHYHHTRKGMWGNSEIKVTKKWSLN